MTQFIEQTYLASFTENLRPLFHLLMLLKYEENAKRIHNNFLTVYAMYREIHIYRD